MVGLYFRQIPQQSIIILLSTLPSEHVIAHFLYMSQQMSLDLLAGEAAAYHYINGSIRVPIILFVELA